MPENSELKALIENARKNPVGKCTCPRNPLTGYRIAFDPECTEHFAKEVPK